MILLIWWNYGNKDYLETCITPFLMIISKAAFINVVLSHLKPIKIDFTPIFVHNFSLPRDFHNRFIYSGFPSSNIQKEGGKKQKIIIPWWTVK